MRIIMRALNIFKKKNEFVDLNEKLKHAMLENPSR